MEKDIYIKIGNIESSVENLKEMMMFHFETLEKRNKAIDHAVDRFAINDIALRETDSQLSIKIDTIIPEIKKSILKTLVTTITILSILLTVCVKYNQLQQQKKKNSTNIKIEDK